MSVPDRGWGTDLGPSWGLILVLASLPFMAIFVACGDDAPPDDDSAPSVDAPNVGDGEVRFFEITHDDGTTYRCVYTYEGHGTDGDFGREGGPAMWCENRRYITAEIGGR